MMLKLSDGEMESECRVFDTAFAHSFNIGDLIILREFHRSTVWPTKEGGSYVKKIREIPCAYPSFAKIHSLDIH